jgi:hypothetical protein
MHLAVLLLVASSACAGFRAKPPCIGAVAYGKERRVLTDAGWVECEPAIPAEAGDYPPYALPDGGIRQ